MRPRLQAFAIAASLTTAAPAAASLPCDADLDRDGSVGIVDLLALLGQWGGDPGGPPDLDGDGSVGIADLLVLLPLWGPVTFDYGPGLPDAEAEQIGLEMLGAAGALRVPEDLFDRIDRDLDLIRSLEPDLIDQTHSPAWLPDEMLVSLVQGAELDQYLCLNEIYGVVNEQLIAPSLNLWLLTFTGNLNIPALVEIYEQAPEVSFAEPNGLIGGQNFWVPTALGGGFWRWDVDDGFHDCFDGCDCHRLYVFRTDETGHAVLVSYQEQGQPWCDFGK